MEGGKGRRERVREGEGMVGREGDGREDRLEKEWEGGEDGERVCVQVDVAVCKIDTCRKFRWQTKYSLP